MAYSMMYLKLFYAAMLVFVKSLLKSLVGKFVTVLNLIIRLEGTLTKW